MGVEPNVTGINSSWERSPDAMWSRLVVIAHGVDLQSMVGLMAEFTVRATLKVPPEP